MNRDYNYPHDQRIQDLYTRIEKLEAANKELEATKKDLQKKLGAAVIELERITVAGIRALKKLNAWPLDDAI